MKRISATARSRAGVTLVELLVVCTIIAVLATMAFPALSGAVARSRLTVCTNNLNQLGYAALRFDEQYGYLPGWLNPITVSTGSIAGTWAIPVLPFIGRSDIFDAIVDTGLLPTQLEVNTFNCPSNTTRTGTSVLHYAANVGATGTNANDGVFVNGYGAGYSAVSLEYIADRDGTATTLAFTEKASLEVSPPHRWTYSTTAALAPSISPLVSGTESTFNLPPVFGIRPSEVPTTPVINNADFKTFAPTSVHAGGVAVVFCDGHTAFLSDKLPYYVYAQLLTPRTRWQGTTAITNSTVMRPWLLKPGNTPYVLDAKDLRQF